MLVPTGWCSMCLIGTVLCCLLLPDNYEGRNILCVYGEAFKGVVNNVTGWSFVDEGGPGKRKWGYISKVPGSLLTIKVKSKQSLRDMICC